MRGRAWNAVAGGVVVITGQREECPGDEPSEGRREWPEADLGVELLFEGLHFLFGQALTTAGHVCLLPVLMRRGRMTGRGSQLSGGTGAAAGDLLFEESCFAVEALRAGVQRNADPVERRLCGDRRALLVSGVKQCTGAVVPERLGDLVDQIIGLLRAGDPLGADRERGDIVAHAF